MSGLLADLLVVLHLAFILFAALGGLLVLKWRFVALLHVPSAVWGVLIEVFGWICPLTPLENRLREAAGESTYANSFVEQHILPIIYPEDLTREIQFVLAAGLLALNLLVYGWVIARERRRSR